MRNAALLLREATALETRDAAMRPRTFDASANTIEAVIATDNPVPRTDMRGPYLESLDIAGANLDALRGASVLDAHRQDAVAAVLGTVDEAWREGAQLVARIRLSGRPEVAAIVEDVRAGVLRSLSIGYEVAEWRDGTSNGQRTRTAVKWSPREVSFVPVAADPRARTRSAESPSGRARQIRDLGRRSGAPMTMVDDLIDSNVTLDHARTALLFDMVERGRSPIRTAVTGGDPVNQQARALGDALYSKMTGSVPQGQARELVHRSTLDLMADHARALGVPLRSNNPMEVYQTVMTRAAGGMHAASDFPTLLGDNMNRRLGELFRAAESGASAIAAPGTARDFRPITEGRLTSFPALIEVPETGEIKYSTLAEEGEILNIASYARAISVSFKTLANDDLGAIDRSVRDIAFATATLKASLIISALSATLRDTKALFHTDHGNIATGGEIDPPNILTLSAGREAMAKQTPPGSTEPLGLSPNILLCPTGLQTTCEQIIAALQPTKVADVNPFAGKLQIAVEPRLGDDDGWYLFASPAIWPVVRFLTLAGYDMPAFETSQEFSRLGTSFRCHWHCGAGPVDHRGAWKNPGTAVSGG